MSTTKLVLIVALTVVCSIDARTLRINRGSSCYCRHRIQKERDDAIKERENMSNEYDKIKNLVTKTSCKEGFVFNEETSHDNIVCDKCPSNHYRNKDNSTCVHCPEGYNAKEGSKICYKASKNDDVHTYCPKGSVVGNNPFAPYKNSCVKCDNTKKEYMPFENVEDKCNICESGSVVKYNNCKKCPIGYYEYDNKCIECNAGTYNDVEGASQCKVCNNEKAIAYRINGGSNCDNSYLYDMAEKINKLVSMEKYSEPIIASTQVASAIIYNNRKYIGELTYGMGVMSTAVAGIYMMFASP